MAEIEHPGVFVEEIASGARPIEGVGTSIAAFVGRTWRGPLDEAVRLPSFEDYERQFGGLWRESTLGFAVRQFFENGGTDAVIVRIATRGGATAARTALIRLQDGEVFRAANPGSWGLNLNITVDRAGLTDDKLFNLTVTDDSAIRRDSEGRGGSRQSEQFKDLSVDHASAQFVGTVLQQSKLLRYESDLRATAPREQTAIALDESGTDGAPVGTAEVTAPDNRAAGTGLYALDKADLFNLLCIPPYAPDIDLDVANDWAPAALYCRERRAMLIIDAPAAWTTEDAVQNVPAFHAIAGENAALYFPRVIAPDPLNGNQAATFAPCGMVAGVMARTDASRGVWQAPAGVAASLVNVTGFSRTLTEADQDALNPMGVNCLRIFPVYGPLVWGARTLATSPDWIYVSVRRLALYIEESIDRGTQWIALEPNEQRTWAAFVQQVSFFLGNLWRAGAFIGERSQDAFFVRCDRTTITEDDIANGRLVAEVFLAPVRPAEFIVLRIFRHTAEANR